MEPPETPGRFSSRSWSPPRLRCWRESWSPGSWAPATANRNSPASSPGRAPRRRHPPKPSCANA